jgi:hypothetical protein
MSVEVVKLLAGLWFEIFGCGQRNDSALVADGTIKMINDTVIFDDPGLVCVGIVVRL